MWARSNLGSLDETARGLYYSWGNKEGHVFGEGYNFDQLSYQLTPGFKLSGDITWVDDPVFAVYGGNWSMPSRYHVDELLSHTGSQWVTDYKGSGVNGRLLTSLVNGETLFFPVTGYLIDLRFVDGSIRCVSATSTFVDVENAVRLSMTASTVSLLELRRSSGLPIRPIVRGPLPPVVNHSILQSLNLIEDE